MNVQNISKIIKSTPVILIVILSLILVKCKKEYLISDTESANLLVIDGSLVKNCDTQKVVISRSIGIGESTAVWEDNFTVYVEDESGNRQDFFFDTLGTYYAYIDDSYMNIGSKYRLIAEGPTGDVYQSEYETIYSCPDIDSIYTAVESQYSYSLGGNATALQFYIDLSAKDSDPRYYRWTMEEDYEFKVPYPINGTWYGDTIDLHLNDVDTIQVCYGHGNVSGLYSANTKNLTVNQKKKIPLNALYAGSRKVSIRYSILVSQYSLTSDAYAYWQQKQVETQESDGLFAAQPSQPSSNIFNVDNSSEIVLGYFWAGSRTTKRAFYNHSLADANYSECVADTVDITADIFYEDLIYLHYLISNFDTAIITSGEKCFDCTKNGGVLEVPEFWKED